MIYKLFFSIEFSVIFQDSAISGDLQIRIFVQIETSALTQVNSGQQIKNSQEQS